MSKPETPPPAATVLTLAEKTHRDVYAIQADLDAARAKYLQMLPVRDRSVVQREMSLVRVESLKKQWAMTNPGYPFDPTAFSPPAVPLAEDTDFAREFHRQHYRVAGFEKELEEAKKAVVNS